MIKKYKTSTFRYNKLIEVVDCVKETEKTVWIKVFNPSTGYEVITCCRKEKYSDQFHDTFEAAQAFLRDKCLTEILSLEKRLKYEQERLAKIESLEKPKE